MGTGTGMGTAQCTWAVSHAIRRARGGVRRGGLAKTLGGGTHGGSQSRSMGQGYHPGGVGGKAHTQKRQESRSGSVVKVPTQSLSATEPSIHKASGPLYPPPLCQECSSTSCLGGSLPPHLQISAPTSPRQRPSLITLRKQSPLSIPASCFILCVVLFTTQQSFIICLLNYMQRGEGFHCFCSVKYPQKGMHWAHSRCSRNIC